MESEWKLKLTPLARTDLEEIYQYISICLDAPQAADRLMTAFEKSFEQLQNHPFSFPRADDESLRKKGYRKLIVENYVGAYCALPGFVDSKNEEKTERNAGYLVVSHSGGGMLRQGTRKGIRRTPANRGMRAHRIVKSLDISEDVCHGLCP